MRQRRLDAPFSRNQVVVEEPAIWAHRGRAPHMQRSHQHDDLELNYVATGHLKYLFGGERLLVPAGAIAMFWASTPHRLIDDNSSDSGKNYWVHIPLSRVFSWALPAGQLRELLTSRPIVLPAATTIGREVEPLFSSWVSDLTGGSTEQCALLEVQALVQRLLIGYLERGGESHPQPKVAPVHDGMQHIVEMAQFTVANFRSDISPSDIAAATHLNPNYAMTLFREVVGTTLGGYLTRCRMAEAQRLLLTTTMTTSEIAHAAGFGSQSSFYAHFTRTCKVSPSAYRNGSSGERQLLEEHGHGRASMCLP